MGDETLAKKLEKKAKKELFHSSGVSHAIMNIRQQLKEE
jgi:hypothetical protein